MASAQIKSLVKSKLFILFYLIGALPYAWAEQATSVNNGASGLTGASGGAGAPKSAGGFSVLSPVQSSGSRSPSGSSAAEPSVERQLQSAVASAQANLGEMPVWQKTLFKDEVMPQFQRFIRDYHAFQEGLKVEVDYKGLKNYLAFYAPNTFKSQVSKILVLLKTDSTCEKCVTSTATITQLVRSKLDRRGLSPVWLSADEVSGASFSSFEDQLSTMAQQRQAVGFLLVRWMPLVAEDLDTAHADEKRYQVQTTLNLRGLAPQTQSKELLDNDPFDTATLRMLGDLFTDLGEKIETDRVLLAENGNDEVLVEVTGVQDFAQYQRIKATLQNQLAQGNEGVSIEDRKFSKTQVVFAVLSKKTADQLRKQIGSFSLDPENSRLLTVVVR